MIYLGKYGDEQGKEKKYLKQMLRFEMVAENKYRIIFNSQLKEKEEEEGEEEKLGEPRIHSFQLLRNGEGIISQKNDMENYSFEYRFNPLDFRHMDDETTQMIIGTEINGKFISIYVEFNNIYREIIHQEPYENIERFVFQITENDLTMENVVTIDASRQEIEYNPIIIE